MQIERGQIWALFAFDIGFAISLERLDRLRQSIPREPLAHKKPTPSYLQYAAPPRILSLGEAPPLLSAPGQILATIFDFGAASISYRWPITPADSLALATLHEASFALYQRRLEGQAAKIAEELSEKIRPAIERPELARMVEDYYLFILEELSPAIPSGELLENHCAPISQALRFEKMRLSLEQQQEAVAERISYYEHDLVIVDWNAAVIYDRDFEDAAGVLELANVELLEARYVDALLDRRLNEYQSLVPRRAAFLIPGLNPFRRAIEELGQMRIEYLVLSERVENALKLIGDLYLARVHRAASRRLYLPAWEAAIARKLEIASDLYQVLIDRVRTAQNQTLEMVIILLILAEIIIALLERMLS